MTQGSGLAVGVVGGSGFTGGELCRLLLGHPDVASVSPTARGDREFERVHPHLRGSGLTFETQESLFGRAEELDVVFFCTPTGEAMRHAPELVAAGVRVVDLSADFRFPDADMFEQAHGLQHTAQDVLAQAVNGVSELHRDEIADARLVANPGCYVIAAVLGLAPLLEAGLHDATQRIHVAAVNGTSGAGTTPRGSLMHSAVFADVLPYNLAGHRHAPEIDMHVGRLSAAPCRGVDLATSHGNFVRGIYLQASVALESDVARESLLETYVDYYGAGHDKEYFVLVNDRVASMGKTEKEYDIYPSMRGVIGSNFCHLGLDVDRRAGVVRVVSVIDNLVKGAAGSAIQNMNIMVGLSETAGLRQYGF